MGILKASVEMLNMILTATGNKWGEIRRSVMWVVVG